MSEVTSAYDLKRAVGELSAARLELAVDIYNPEIHYNEVRGLWWGTSSDGDVNQEDFGKPD
jgi:outer membrane protein